MTRKKLIFYWALYGFTALLFLLLQSVLLNRLSILHGIHPILLPLLVGLTAIYTPRGGSAVFAFFFGFLCDMLFVGAIPCFYLLTFTICAIAAGLLSHRFITPGFFCSFLMGGLSLLITDLLQMFFLTFQTEVPFLIGITVLLAELLLSLPFLLLLHPVYSRINRFLMRV